MKKLAIKGGEPVRSVPFPPYRTIGREEKEAVMKVMDSGVLSDFLGAWSPQFYGGTQVQRLEEAWCSHFGVKHAITMNSNTSGLYAVLGAAGIGPGDEVIVSPYSMCASATCAVVNHAVPVFADIDPDTFCISAETIEPLITPRTKAIVVVDIFGRPAEMDPIMVLADKHGLFVLEDAAQAPGARYSGKLAGTLAHAGVFSLNYHKTIHTGEGGVVVTNDDRLADRVRLIRNHAEVVVKAKGETDLINMVGFNYRMTEMEAAIGVEQLKKLTGLVACRKESAEFLQKRLSGLPCLVTPKTPSYIEHGWYCFPMRYVKEEYGPLRQSVVDALQAEGLPVSAGYVMPIYLQPMYQKKIAFGSCGFPFSGPHYSGVVDYSRGICPVTERMHFEEVLVGNYCHGGMEQPDLEDVCSGYEKVFSQLEIL